MDSIPVIDFGLISNFGVDDNEICSKENFELTENWNILTDQVYQALSKVGFMYIINHGIPEEKIDLAFTESEKFFKQPIEMKEKFQIDISKNNEGFTKSGQERFEDQISHEYRESFALVRPDEWFTMTEVPGFVPAMQELRNECQPTLRKLLRLLGMALGLRDTSYFIKTFSDGRLNQIADRDVQLSTMRTHFYPALPEDFTIPKNSVRCSEHTDYGTLTLLFQDAMGGLEVKSNNKWIPAKPIPGSILVNTGDVIEFWTNGIFPATPHRVLIPDEEVRKRKHRQSIVYFVLPDNQTMIEPLTSRMTIPQAQQKPLNQRSPIKYVDYFQQRMKETYGYK